MLSKKEEGKSLLTDKEAITKRDTFTETLNFSGKIRPASRSVYTNIDKRRLNEEKEKSDK